MEPTATPETPPQSDGALGVASATSGSAFWVLFEHMSQNHGLTLLDSELFDICYAVACMRKEWELAKLKRHCRKCGGSGQVEIQSGPYYRECEACGGSGQNAEDYIITDYWLTYYATDHCTLCGNSGVIDTSEARTGAGLKVGRKNYCICPNGQTLRSKGEDAHPNQK